jgi:hypothetical protein
MSAAVTAEIPQTYDRTGDDVLAERAAEIRRLGKCVIADIIEIGRRLTECQGIVGHGNAAEAKAIEAIESGDYEEEAWLERQPDDETADGVADDPHQSEPATTARSTDEV